jgi:hypothetical protein
MPLNSIHFYKNILKMILPAKPSELGMPVI